MAQSPTKPSTRRPSDGRRLTEVARHVVIPEGIVSTGWPAVEALCCEWGDEFDEWQRGAGRVILGKREDGIYAATVGGVTLSIPRQVAKTFLVMRIVFALCALFPGLTVLWTAHRTRTATRTFRSMQGFAGRKKVSPLIDHIRSTNGEQEIGFANGSVIMFGARELGFGRGFDEVDIEVFDEAQILTVKALEDMVAATNQSRHPHGALLFYMGTPPRPADPGEVFEARRTEALSGESEDAVYIECSADPDADPDDRKQWAKANPSFPARTPLRSMLRLRKNLPSDDAWRREALGIWDQAVIARSVVDWGRWSALATDSPPTDGRLAYAVRFSVDGSRVALAVASRPAVGVPHVELVRVRDMAAGTSWIVDWLVERWRKGRVCIDGKSGAGALVNALRAQGVPERAIVTPKVDEVIAAHAAFAEAITSGGLSHFAQEPLDAAVRGAGRRSIGTAGGWGWAPLSPDVDVTPLEAVTLALHTVSTGKRGSGRSSGEGRRAVVLG